ncbi:MAG: hypothetical protein NUW02_01055 [Candidatus Campbellbacteria bacterium]|nr:hypothetical protein [Candidatus Campbellbacteria bacterium]
MFSHFYTKIVVTLLVVLFVITPVGLSLSTGMQVQRVQAGSLPLGELGKGFVSTVAACAITAFIMKYVSGVVAILPSATVPAGTAETPVKKMLDCILYGVVNVIIEDMIKSITRWAQSGFEGNPVFVTQLDSYMRDVVDKQIGLYLESKIPLLCSPFKLDVQLALMQSYQTSSGRYQGSCSLTEAVGNVEGFLGGNFYDGGWNGWVDLVSNPYSNPYGSYLEADREMKIKILATTDKQTKDIAQGAGYLSKQVQQCYAMVDGTRVDMTAEDYENANTPAGADDVGCDEPRTVTPGSYIQEQVAKTTGLSMERLSFADELNEMITAIVAFLVRDVLLGEKGLAGYDPNDFLDDTYPDLPSLDEIEIPGVDTGGDFQMCLPENLWEIYPLSDGVPGQAIRIPSSQYPATGLPFTSTPSNPSLEIPINMGVKQNYSRVQISFTVTVGDQYQCVPVDPPTPECPVSLGDQYNVFWLHRDTGWGQNDVVELVSRQHGGQLAFKTSVNLVNGSPCAATLNNGSRFSFVAGQTYRVEVDYNPGLRGFESGAFGQMSLKINGSAVASLNTGTNGQGINVLQSNPPFGKHKGKGGFKIVLGGAENAEGNEGAPYGWTWRDLNVVFTPGPATTADSGDDDGSGCVPWGTTTCEGPVPTATLTATSPVNSGTPTTISWSSTDATSCDVTQGSNAGFSTGSALSGSDTSFNLTATTTFAIRCRGTGGAANKSATVTIGGAPTATLTASPNPVNPQSPTILTWSSTGATACSVTAGSDSGFEIVGSAPSGSDDSDDLIASATTFAILCTGTGGTATASVVVNADATPTPLRLFIDDRDTPGQMELYKEASSGITKLSGPLVADGNVLFFKVSQNGRYVAYSASARNYLDYELYTVPITGGAVTRISHTLPFDYDVKNFDFSPDGQRVVYQAGRTSIGLWELFSTPSASAGALRISQQMDAGENVQVQPGQEEFKISCDSETVYFLADTTATEVYEAYSVPIGGGTITLIPGGQLPVFPCVVPF